MRGRVQLGLFPIGSGHVPVSDVTSMPFPDVTSYALMPKLAGPRTMEAFHKSCARMYYKTHNLKR